MKSAKARRPRAAAARKPQPIVTPEPTPSALVRIARLWREHEKDRRALPNTLEAKVGRHTEHRRLEEAIDDSMRESTINEIKWLLDHGSGGNENWRLCLKDAMLLREILRSYGGATFLLDAIIQTLMGEVNPARQERSWLPLVLTAEPQPTHKATTTRKRPAAKHRKRAS